MIDAQSLSLAGTGNPARQSALTLQPFNAPTIFGVHADDVGMCPARTPDTARETRALPISCHPVKKSASFCATYDQLPSPNLTRVTGIICEFRIQKEAQNNSLKKPWRSSACENPPKANKGNCPQKNSEIFSGRFYRKSLINHAKIIKKTG